MELRQSGRNVAHYLDALLIEAAQPDSRQRQEHDDQSDRPARQQPRADHQQGDSGQANGQRQQVSGRELLRQEPEPLEEVVAAALHTQQLGQLRRRDDECRSGLEAGQDALGDEVD